MQTPAVRLLAATNNARGDLFTRLVKDLFFALGYDELRLDVSKSGRELDVQGTHRLEIEHRMVAECKAQADPIGGRDVNTFLGVLTRERDRQEPNPVSGYFVSLSGFRDSQLQQEADTSPRNRVILLDGEQVVEELQRAHVLVGRDEAVERAGHCAEHAGLSEAVLDGAELLGHDMGYLWAVFYAHGKERTHFALIHADATPLAEAVAGGVIDADRKCRGTLHKLEYLAPPPPAPDRAALGRAALDQYCRWVEAECGHIQLDGLPADSDLSATRMKLERLFVPLKVSLNKKRPTSSSSWESSISSVSASSLPASRVEHDEEPLASSVSDSTARSRSRSAMRSKARRIGRVLSHVRHLALLASPGGGKSTLLRRLAIAYAVPERRTEVDDGLPQRDWLPLFLRCRELRDRAHRPILELLDDLPQHAGMNADESATFRERIHESLRSGRALLLVDGLDEISDEGARRTFAGHLRTFLAIFPRAALVVTSREAGFRHVAGVVAGACTQATLAPFDKDDVRRLSECWLVEVVGDNDQVRADARELAATIWRNERIRALAENPLMLTTLLVVKRWLRELPRSRVKLYQGTIHVLIRTWNVEGYEPLDEDETLARLSYVACEMMDVGAQQIGHKALLKLLQQAQRELAAELQFASISPPEFIERIEYRSSLLMQIGHQRFDGELQPVYEFRHLTFQEYLAARGLVEEQYSGRDAGRSLADLLQPHFEDERWREVIPLAAVLAGRKAEELIQRLTAACEGRVLERGYAGHEDVNERRVVLLRQCLFDEVQVTPPTLRAALRQMARHGHEGFSKGSTVNLRRAKFGTVFQQVAEEAYFGKGRGWEEFSMAVADLAVEAVFQDRTPWLSADVAESLAGRLTSGDRIEQGRAACVCVYLAYRLREPASAQERVPPAEGFQPLRDALGKLLSAGDPPLALAASWALAWTGAARTRKTPPEPGVLLSLYRLWREPESSELARHAAWAFSTQPLLPRDTFDEDAWGNCDAWFEQTAGEADEIAPLVLAWYRRTPWNDSELAQKMSETHDPKPNPTPREILATLGEPGRRVLEEWDKGSGN